MSESESALPRPAVFAVASISLVVVFAAAGAPIPLLVSLGASEGAGRADLAGVAAAYFAGTLGALLVFGRVSDHIGRRPMAVAALLAGAAASGITAATDDVSVFVAARVLQGVSIGLAAAPVGALVVDTAPRRAPWLGGTVAAAAAPVGVPIGVLAMSLWFDTADAVLTVLCVLLVACAVVVVGVGAGRRRPGALRSLLPRFSSPRSRRAHVVAVFVATGAMWAFGGVHQTFGPTIAADAFGETSPLVGGLVFVALPLGTPLGAIVIGLIGPRRSVMVGVVGSAFGVAGVWASVVSGALPWFVVSCVLVGASQAAVLGGAAAWILARTDIEHRAGALATYSFVSYGSAAAAAAGLISAAHPSAGPGSVLPVAAVATVAATLLILGLFRLPDASNENAR